MHETKTLDTSSVIFVIVVSVLVTASLMYIILTRMKLPSENESLRKTPGVTMQLQAYERLLILVDRMALPHLISRINQPHATAREMQLLLTQNIRSEFDYNITQQIYVSPDAWNAVKNLKEQNLLIVNQLANVLPPNATGLDLNKLLLEFLMNDKKGTLHEVVSEALSYEAKKLME